MTEPALAYSGIETLEVMTEAVNYNTFLQRLVTDRARRDENILDFGAGAGSMALPLATAGYRVICVEPDPFLRARLRDSGLEAHESLDAVPLGSLDLIYSFNVLEHIEEDESAVLALRERLRPGGRLLIYVPAFPILYSSLDRQVGHFRRYRRGRLAGLLCRNGMALEQIAYKDCLGFPASLLFKAFGNENGRINRCALIAYDRWVFPLSRGLDSFTGRWFGKNLFALAHREDEKLAMKASSRGRSARAEMAQFLRFCAVGGVGFCVDAAVLVVCVHWAGFNALTGRLISSAAGVLTTFTFNRVWAFRQARRQGFLRGLTAYLAVQAGGWSCNFGVYTLAHFLLPRPLNTPLLCLVGGSAAALLINYSGSRFAVFPMASSRVGPGS